MKKARSFFHYLPKAQAFLSNRIDEGTNYHPSVEVFEYMVGRNPKIGDIIAKWQPATIRRFPVIVPKCKDLSFYYWFAEKGRSLFINVVLICFVEDEKIK